MFNVPTYDTRLILRSTEIDREGNFAYFYIYKYERWTQF